MKNFIRERTGLHHTHDDRHWYHIRHWETPDDDYWTLDVFDNVDGHCGDKCVHFERADGNEIFRLARSIHDYAEAHERIAA